MVHAAAHIPVLLPTVLHYCQPIANSTIIDATFGAGGYSTAFLQAGANVIALDRDPNAIANGAALVERFSPRLALLQRPFSELASCVLQPVDAVVMDIGVSSMQIDQAARGFSFQKDGPLDMRMSQSGISAADVVNNFAQPDLTRLFGLLGEERHASRIARMIVNRRQTAPFTSTLDLSEAISKLVGQSHKDSIHPATRVFQALRIYVNDELHELIAALFAAETILKPGGRLVVVSFHSLEDRIVKNFLAARSKSVQPSRHLPVAPGPQASFSLLCKGAHQADAAERAANPRARSARLRAAIRQPAPAHKPDLSLFRLPNLPKLQQLTTTQPNAPLTSGHHAPYL